MVDKTSLDSSLQFILQDIKDDIKVLDARWEASIVQGATTGAAVQETLKSITETVEKLNEVLISGNGRPSILVQVSELQKDVAQLVKIQNDLIKGQEDGSEKLSAVCKDLAILRAELGINSTPQEVKKARLVLATKIVVLITVMALEAAAIASTVMRLSQ